jgi:acyl-CoA thioesterase
MVGDVFLQSHYVRLFGVELEERRSGYGRMSLTTGPAHTDCSGAVHGGVITTMIDSAIAVALRELRGDHVRVQASIEMNVTFLQQAQPGDEIVVEGRISRLDPGVAFGEAEVRLRPSGDLLALGRVTFAIQQEKS